MTSPRRDRRARRRISSTAEAELLAAKRVVSEAERRAVEEAEGLREDAQRLLEAAGDEAEGILAQARTEAERILAAAAATAGTPDDPEQPRREAALSAVEPSDDDVAVLRELLRDDLSADTRVAAVGALARASELDQLEALTLALADPDPAVRAGAVDALPVARTARAAPRILAAADDDHEAVRAAAHRRLAGAPSWIRWVALGRCSHRQELLAVLEEVEDEGHEAAGGGLEALLVERMSSPDVADRVLALELAVHLRTPAVLREAIEALADTEAVVRVAAATQLRGCELATPGLVTALGDDPDPAVRREAARALADVQDEDVLLALVAALQDPDGDVRRVAVDAICRHPSAALVDLLVADLTTSNLDSVGEALLGMGTLGQEALASAAKGASPERAAAAVELLGGADSASGPESDEEAPTTAPSPVLPEDAPRP